VGKRAGGWGGWAIDEKKFQSSLTTEGKGGKKGGGPSYQRTIQRIVHAHGEVSNKQGTVEKKLKVTGGKVDTLESRPEDKSLQKKKGRGEREISSSLRLCPYPGEERGRGKNRKIKGIGFENYVLSPG